MIIALDFKYEQRSPRPRSPSQRFLSAACIYNLAPLLIYGDLTKLSELTQHTKKNLSWTRYIRIFWTRTKSVAQDSDLHNTKNYGSQVP